MSNCRWSSELVRRGETARDVGGRNDRSYRPANRSSGAVVQAMRSREGGGLDPRADWRTRNMAEQESGGDQPWKAHQRRPRCAPLIGAHLTQPPRAPAAYSTQPPTPHPPKFAAARATTLGSRRNTNAMRPLRARSGDWVASTEDPLPAAETGAQPRNASKRGQNCAAGITTPPTTRSERDRTQAINVWVFFFFCSYPPTSSHPFFSPREFLVSLTRRVIKQAAYHQRDRSPSRHNSACSFFYSYLMENAVLLRPALICRARLNLRTARLLL